MASKKPNALRAGLLARIVRGWPIAAGTSSSVDPGVDGDGVPISARAINTPQDVEIGYEAKDGGLGFCGFTAKHERRCLGRERWLERNIDRIDRRNLSSNFSKPQDGSLVVFRHHWPFQH